MPKRLIRRRRTFGSRWRANFFAGLAIVLPIAISVGVFLWLFGTVTKFTDTLLFFIPPETTRGAGNQVHWWWSCVAFAWAAALVGIVGRLARYYIGKKFIRTAERVMLAIPILNTIYGAVKQINEAFASDKASAFEQVVMVEFPRKGAWSVGFLTGDNHPEANERLGKKLNSVFVPTTPNPTSGFLCFVTDEEIIKMEMSVADGVKYIMSLGAVAPIYPPLPEAAETNDPDIVHEESDDEEDEMEEDEDGDGNKPA
jgi:uncharacterized membrane protein